MISITPFAASSLRQMVVERLAGVGTQVGGPFGAAGDKAACVVSENGGGVEGQCASGVTGASNEEPRLGLRIMVEKGGCAGMQYTMQLDSERPTDEVNEAGGVFVFVDPQSASFIDGSELDYCDDLVGTGFRLRNPRATRSCGCGTSFEPAGGDAVTALEISGS